MVMYGCCHGQPGVVVVVMPGVVVMVMPGVVVMMLSWCCHGDVWMLSW